jgi:hypothetical protein
LCKFCASFSERFVLAHRLLKPDPRRVQIRVGRLDVRVTEQLLHMMQGHPALKPPRSGFVTQIVEVQIDLGEPLTARIGEPVCLEERVDEGVPPSRVPQVLGAAGQIKLIARVSSPQRRDTLPAKRYGSIGSAPAKIVRIEAQPGVAGALSIGAFGRSRWRLRRARSTYVF